VLLHPVYTVSAQANRNWLIMNTVEAVFRQIFTASIGLYEKAAMKNLAELETTLVIVPILL